MPFGRRLGKHGQLGPPPQFFCEIHHLEAKTKIGLVRPVPGHGISEGEARVWSRGTLTGKLGDEPAEEQLDLAENVFLRGKRHLEVDLVKLAGATVRPGRLVPEARCDLEVAFDPAHHQQLLELLGRLGEGVELTWVEAARHEVVAGALGRRGSEHGRLDLQETAPGEVRPDQLAEPGPLGQALGQRPSPHVEVAVREPGFLAHVGVSFHGEREDLGRRKDLDAAHVDLDLSRKKLGVDSVRRAGHHLAADRDDALQPQVGQRLERRPPGVAHQLDHPGPMVALQVAAVPGALCLRAR